MNNDAISKANEDIQLIKAVLSRTSTSISLFSKTFFWWGILQLCTNTLTIADMKIFNFFYKIPYFYTGFSIIMYLIAFVVYRNISVKVGTIGLGRQLMTLWLAIYTFEVVLTNVYLILHNFIDNSSVKYGFPIQSLFFIMYAFGMLCICVFTGLKLPGFLAAGYALIGVSYMLASNLTCFNNLYLPSHAGLLVNLIVISLMLVSLTYFILGVYLKLIMKKGD